jgi:hypothetical protein
LGSQRGNQLQERRRGLVRRCRSVFGSASLWTAANQDPEREAFADVEENGLRPLARGTDGMRRG